MPTTAPYSYNVNPAPQTGYSAYGGVPGSIGIPPSTYQQVSSLYPNLGGQGAVLSNNIGSELLGELSPQTIAQLQQHASQFGAASGMPGSQFSGNQGLASLGQNVEATQQQGQQNYLSALTGIGSTTTPQSLAAGIAESNAQLAAAPSPQAAAEQQMADWMKKFQMTAGAGRGGGGTALPNSPQKTTAQTPWYTPTAWGPSPDTYSQPSDSYLNSLLPPGLSYGQNNAAAYDPFGEGEAMAGTIQDPNSAWWDTSPAGGTDYSSAYAPLAGYGWDTGYNP